MDQLPSDVETPVSGKSVVPARWRLIALSFLPILLAILGIAMLKQSPYTGMGFAWDQDQWKLSSVHDGSAAEVLRPWLDSAVVSLAGIPLEEYFLAEDYDYVPDMARLQAFWNFQEQLSRNLHIGDSVSVGLGSVTGGVIRKIPVVSFPLSEVLDRVWMMYFLGLASLALGVLLMLRKPTDPRSQAFYAMVYSVACIFVSFGTYISRETVLEPWFFQFLRWINGAAFLLFPLLFFRFCLVFPRERKMPLWHTWLQVVVLLVVGILYQTRLSYDALSLYFILGLVVGAILVFVSYFTARNALERHQVLWVMMGILVFVTVFLATGLVPQILLGHRLFSDRVPSLFFLAIPLSIVFAISRFHLMGIHNLFDQFLAYLISLLLLAGLDLLVVSALESAVANDEATRTVLIVFTVWVGLLVYMPVRNLVLKAIQRVMKRPDMDGQQQLLRMGDHLALVEDSQTVLPAAMELLMESLRSRGGLSCSADAGAQRLPLVVSGNWEDALPVPEELLALAEKNRAPVHLYQIEEELVGTLSNLPPTGLLVPVRGVEDSPGCVVLAPHQGSRLYTRAELDLCKAMAHLIGTTWDRLRLQERTREQEREMRKEKERLAREIHDGIGGDYVNAIMALDLAMQEGASRDESFGSGRLSDLRAMMSGNLSWIRDLVWSIDGSDASLEDLSVHLREKIRRLLEMSGAEYSLHVSVEEGQVRIPHATRIHLVRMAQEMLSNALQHSGSKRMEFVFRQENGWITMSLQDYGKGFDPSVGRVGNGLQNLRNRSREMMGSMTLESAPGLGTTVTVHLPVADARLQSGVSPLISGT